MFTTHLIFGDIDGSSRYGFKERVTLIESFHKICLERKPGRLSKHSFFSIDNDSLMIGFAGQNGFDRGYDVLNFVSMLSKDFEEAEICVSFGVYLMALDYIPFEFEHGFAERRDMIYMPSDAFLKKGRVIRRLLVGDPLIVADRLLRISKTSNHKICFAVNNGAFLNGMEDNEWAYREMHNWKESLNNEDYTKFLKDYGINKIYYLK